jgi:hypothetical protein
MERNISGGGPGFGGSDVLDPRACEGVAYVRAYAAERAHYAWAREARRVKARGLGDVRGPVAWYSANILCERLCVSNPYVGEA